MKRPSKVVLLVVAGIATLAALPLVGLLMIFAGNVGGGVYSWMFERQPTMSEMLGTYVFHGGGKPSTIRLSSDGSFAEQVTERDNSQRKTLGHWTFRREDNYADMTFRPFDDPRVNGKQSEEFPLICRKRRFGGTYLQLDPDLPETFEHQR